MDHFLEEVVVKHRRGMQEVLYIMANVLMVLMALLGMMMLPMLFSSFSVFGLIETAIMIGGAVLLFLRKDRLRAEFEYTFTNGELDLRRYS